MAPEPTDPDPAARLIPLPFSIDRTMVARGRQFVCTLALIAGSTPDSLARSRMAVKAVDKRLVRREW